MLVIRGLYHYTPRVEDRNYMWIISHPEKVLLKEINSFDHVFIASKRYLDAKIKLITIGASLLDQCTDPDLFFSKPEIKKDIDILFIGNSRNEFRKIVKDALDQNLPIKVIGRDWENFIPKKYIIRQSVKHEELNLWYNRAQIILNDHWDSMRDNGFISNRIFDVTASGSCIISDLPQGDISRIKSENIKFYTKPGELNSLVQKYLKSHKFNPKILNTFDLAIEEILKIDKISFKKRRN